MKRSGFTIIELLVYIAILLVVMGLFVGIIGTSTRVGITESSANEVSNQLNFVVQTIQRLVRESSAVIVNSSSPCNLSNDSDVLGAPGTCLKIRMKDSTSAGRDPIYIWKDASGNILEQEGNVSPIVNTLTTSKVTSLNNSLLFTKLTNYPGKDIIGINLTLNYNSGNPQAKLQRTLNTSIGRVSAATFDTAVLPGTSATLDLGLGNQYWKNLYLKDYRVEDGKVYEKSNYDNLVNGRGMLTIGAPNVNNTGAFPTCSAICTEHDLICNWSLGFDFSVNGALGGFSESCSNGLPYGGICFCE